MDHQHHMAAFQLVCVWTKCPNKQRCRRVAPEAECRDAPFDQHPEHWSKAAEAEHASAIRRKSSPPSAGKRPGDTSAPHCAVGSLQEWGDHSHEVAATLCWYIRPTVFIDYEQSHSYHIHPRWTISDSINSCIISYSPLINYLIVSIHVSRHRAYPYL